MQELLRGSLAEALPLCRQLTASTEKFALAGGWGHNLAMVKGQLWAWGRNDFGQLGLGNAGNQGRPVKVPSNKNFVAIAAGQVHSLALSDDGTLWTWGYNANGELGIGNTNHQRTPVQVAFGKKFVAIAAGAYHSLALSDGGTLWTWGYNNHGQLGIGNTNHQLNPVQVAVGKKFVAIAAGVYHSLALSDGGTLWTWGRNQYGQLGIGNTNGQLNPVQVAVGESFQFPIQFLLSAWCDPVAADVLSGACAVSAGSALPCSSAFLKARSCSCDGCTVFAGAKAAEPCDAGTFCPAGKGCAITCPEGHYCTLAVFDVNHCRSQA